MDPLVQIRKGTGGDRLFVAGIELPSWFGIDHKERLKELRTVLNEALALAFEQRRANWFDKPSAGDAWKRMIYVCQDCRHSERIWNARPHVTPFAGVPCPACGGDMKHEFFSADETVPNYRPRAGELVFIDLPPELALIYARRRVENAQAGGYDIPGGQDPENYARELALEFLQEFGGHTPTVVRLIR